MSRRRSLSFIPYRVIIRRSPPSIPAEMLVLMLMLMLMLLVTRMRSGLLLAGLVNSRALGNAIVVALPDDVGVWGEGKQAFDRFPTTRISSERDIIKTRQKLNT